MLFFPFRVDLNFNRIPLLTILVCVACLFVFIKQEASFEEMQKASKQYCQKDHERMFWLVIEKVYGERDVEACSNVFYHIHSFKYPEQRINELVGQADKFNSRTEVSSRIIIRGMLEEKYREFKLSGVKNDLTAQLMYEPHSYNLVNMITAAFAHGSWDHLLGNLFFFFAFAASIEMILGMLRYTLIFASLSVGTHLSYSLAMMNINEALPTLGLSGVVMGMIGVFVYLMPKINIRCFLWFIIIFRIVKVPAWLLAAWYVSWDIYALYFSDGQSAINFIAHISGATIGFGLGLIFLIERKEEIAEEMRLYKLEEEKKLAKEE
ncbi:MAG: rhomboid family intramembrane serine protease [Gammaproteobacteria bacterium]|nr:rhomboid family intramembrane serine protease [Gammaproteobacteria bacterium]MDH5660251.1 rhomboid family intramembrane serine protease [Gammaproteobacteria bacterium]